MYISTGFTDKDMSHSFLLPLVTHIGGDQKTLPLSEIKNRLCNIYCSHIGLEYMHINDRSRCKCLVHVQHQPKEHTCMTSVLYFTVLHYTTLSYDTVLYYSVLHYMCILYRGGWTSSLQA